METPKMQQFKVYFDNAAGTEKETRRFNILFPLPSEKTLFDIVQQKITDILGHNNFRITWKDSDGDWIVCANEDDLAVPVQVNANKDVLCLYVKSIAPPQYQAPPAPVPRLFQGSLQTNRTCSFASAAVVEHPHGLDKHRNVLCDKCDKAILGTRYKCLVCPDFDLCVQCEAKGLHREHDAVAIRKPGQMDWRKLFAVRESTYGRGHQQPSAGAQQPHNGPTVELDLNLNQPLESLLRDVNTQVQRVLKGFMPQDITVSSSKSSSSTSTSTSSSTEVPQKTNQETFTETVVVVESDEVPVVVVNENADNQVETLHESVTEQGSARPTDEKVAESIYPVIFPHLVSIVTEQAETVSFAEARRSSSPVSLISSVEDEDWAFVSEDVESATKDAVTETQTPTKENPGTQIEAALDAMSEMGFKNEGNLLRALLENFHGDIGKVLDTISQ